MAYATAEELSALVRSPSPTQDTAYSAGRPLAELLDEVLETASQSIDEICGRSFAVAEDDPSDRTFVVGYKNPREGSFVLTDDFAVAPASVSDGDDVVPADMWRVRFAPTSVRAGRHLVFSEYYFRNEQVTVSARWGWPAVPPAIKQATLMAAGRLYIRQHKPLGVAQVEDFEQFVYIPRRDYALMDLLEPYKVGQVR